MTEIMGFAVLNVKKPAEALMAESLEIAGMYVEITDEPAILFAGCKKILTTAF